MDKINIRRAAAGDAEKSAEIYSYYVLNTAVTFEYDPPGAAEFEKRILYSDYPFLVAERDGIIAGYASAGRFRTKPAYDYCAETSIYLCPDCRKQGIGDILYDKLQKELKKQNILTVYACVASAPENDPYLTDGSVIFHGKMGFKNTARLEKCGFKFGRWYDIVYFEKDLGQKGPSPKAFISYANL